MKAVDLGTEGCIDRVLEQLDRGGRIGWLAGGARGAQIVLEKDVYNLALRCPRALVAVAAVRVEAGRLGEDCFGSE